jgi:uncharacterized membrane protein
VSDDVGSSHYERAHNPERVVFLSDGVVAIIITLLVLEIHVPELHNGQSLWAALATIRPSLVAFLISFVVVAIAWAGHRDLFTVIRRTDRALVWLNFIYLLPLCLIPFGAALISRYPSETVALRLYGLLLVLIAVTRIAIWVYATGQGHLLYDPPDPQFRRAGVTVVLGPAAAYLVAIAIASVWPTATLVIYGVVPLAYFLGITFARSSAPSGSAESDLT